MAAKISRRPLSNSKINASNLCGNRVVQKFIAAMVIDVALENFSSDAISDNCVLVSGWLILSTPWSVEVSAKSAVSLFGG